MDINQDVLAAIPAMNPPPGEFTDFEGRYSMGPIAIGILSAVMAIMLICVVLRLYVRFLILRKPGADDYLIIAAALCTVSMNSLGIYTYTKFLGTHQWNVRITEVTPRFIQSTTGYSCFYSLSAMFTKCSLLVFYRRLFTVSLVANWLIWGGIVFIVVCELTFLIIKIVFCNPSDWPSGNNVIEFLMAQNSSRCAIPTIKVVIAEGAVSLLTDISLVAIPVVMISSLNLSFRRKMGMYALFLVGLLATGCSIATTRLRVSQLDDEDFSWIAGIHTLLGMLELNAGIICACIPVAFVILRRITNYSLISSLKGCFGRMRKRNRTTIGSLSGREKASWPPPTAAPRSTADGQGDFLQNTPPTVQVPKPTIWSRIGSGARPAATESSTSSSAAHLTKLSTLTTSSEMGSAEEGNNRQPRPQRNNGNSVQT